MQKGSTQGGDVAITIEQDTRCCCPKFIWTCTRAIACLCFLHPSTPSQRIRANGTVYGCRSPSRNVGNRCRRLHYWTLFCCNFQSSCPGGRIPWQWFYCHQPSPSFWPFPPPSASSIAGRLLHTRACPVCHNCGWPPICCTQQEWNQQQRWIEPTRFGHCTAGSTTASSLRSSNGVCKSAEYTGGIRFC